MGKTESQKTMLAVLCACLAALAVKVFVFDVMITQGRSMEPVIKAGSVLVVGKLSYGFRLPWSNSYLVRWADPAIGDVVVFWTPQGVTAVKRCTSLTHRGTFIAEGDNSGVSLDSRDYGPVPIDSIIGKALWIK